MNFKYIKTKNCTKNQKINPLKIILEHLKMLLYEFEQCLEQPKNVIICNNYIKDKYVNISEAKPDYNIIWE